MLLVVVTIVLTGDLSSPMLLLPLLCAGCAAVASFSLRMLIAQLLHVELFAFVLLACGAGSLR